MSKGIVDGAEVTRVSFPSLMILFVASFAVSWFVDDFAMALGLWVENRLGSYGGSILSYNLVHYIVFQAALILLVIGVFGAVKIRGRESVAVVAALTLGKLLGRAISEQPPTATQAIFSVTVSTILSMSTLVLASDLLIRNPQQTGSDTVYTVSSQTFIAIIAWFTVFSLVDAAGNLDISNLSRIGMALTLLFIGFLNARENRPRWSISNMLILTAYSTAGLLISSLLSEALTRTPTLTALRQPDMLLYITSRAPLGFYLSLIVVSGYFLTRFSTK